MLGRLIDRFGVQAIMGRPVMGAGEIKRILYAEGIVAAYRDRGAAKNWNDWARTNKYWSERLNEAMLMAIEMGLVKDGDL